VEWRHAGRAQNGADRCSARIGALAYLLKNRFYVGELVYRGEVHRGEHEPILDSTLFEATELENAEYLKLKAPFHEEDRDHDRLSELSWKEF
jgi:hypothetical protein